MPLLTWEGSAQLGTRPPVGPAVSSGLRRSLGYLPRILNDSLDHTLIMALRRSYVRLPNEIVGGYARQRFSVTYWRSRGDTHTACVATKSTARATVKIRRTRQRSTSPDEYAAMLGICFLVIFYDQLESHCSSYGRCPVGRCIPGSATPIARSAVSKDTADHAQAPYAVCPLLGIHGAVGQHGTVRGASHRIIAWFL